MSTYYYIARKKRFGRLVYAGDGIQDADNEREVKRIVARGRKVRQANVEVRLHKPS